MGRPVNDDLNVAESRAYGKNGNIHFLGRKSFEEIVPYLKSCLCTTVPSEWYDNFPNVVLESYAYKKAVIATDFGSLQFMVDDERTGLKFRYADLGDFRKRITCMFENPNKARMMGEYGYKLIETKYSPETHYKALIEVFNEIKK